MEVTPIGWILLIVGPLLMILRPKWLYAVAIFSLPFTATAVINVGSGGHFSSLQAPMYFGALLLLRFGASALGRLSFPLPRVGRGQLLCLGLFMVAVSLSLIVPWWYDGRIMAPLRLGEPDAILHLNSSQFTQLLYVIFGFAYAYFIATINQNPAKLRLTLKAFLAGAVFTSLWALMEFACKVSGVRYPAMIFNTGKDLSTRGFTQNSEDLHRLASVTVEPSNLAEILLIAIPLILPYVFGSPVLFGRVKDRTIFAIMLTVVCLSTSSTGYFGILLIVITTFCLFCIRGVMRIKYLVWPALLTGVSILLYNTVPAIQYVLSNQIFLKAQGGGSTLERALTVANAYEVFLQHPILGIGWSSIVSYDLVVNILANSGLIGLLTFVVAMYSLFRLLYHSIKSREVSQGGRRLMRIDFAAYLALTAILGTSAIAGIPYVFTFFWFVFGLAVAAVGSMRALAAVTRNRDRLPVQSRSALGI